MQFGDGSAVAVGTLINVGIAAVIVLALGVMLFVILRRLPADGPQVSEVAKASIDAIRELGDTFIQAIKGQMEINQQLVASQEVQASMIGALADSQRAQVNAIEMLCTTVERMRQESKAEAEIGRQERRQVLIELKDLRESREAATGLSGRLGRE